MFGEVGEWSSIVIEESSGERSDDAKQKVVSCVGHERSECRKSSS